LFGAAFLGSILYLTQFNQQVFGATPTESGLMLLPMIAGLMFTAIGSGQIIARTGRYKIFMQFGIVLATIMVFVLSTLSPSSSYAYEAVLMVLLGMGLGVVMPVMNLAVQNEFALHELGVATSSNQLFRSLGSTVGIAVFGAMLTAGLTSGLSGIQSDPYLTAIKQNPQASKIGDFNDSNTLLTLNMPDVKSKIKDGFNKALDAQPNLPQQVKTQARDKFYSQQSDYADKVTSAFGQTLDKIFIVSASLMLAATVLVFMIREKKLKAASPEQAPGVA